MFTMSVIDRYSSRCVLIEFFDPPLDMSLRYYMKISNVLKTCSSCVGMCIALGKKFLDKGIDETDLEIIPLLKKNCHREIHPRVLMSYGILLWFCLQVCTSLISEQR